MRHYTLCENIISVLLGTAIAIPLCVTACEARDIKNSPVVSIDTIREDMVITDPEPVEEIVEETEEVISEEWIDGGYNDREYIGEFKITAYCACPKCCGVWADGLTYTETIATEGRTIAVDPDVIPLGSLVEINGINYVAEDIGGAIDGNEIDLYFDSHKDALEWGVQYHSVYMVEVCLGDFF